MIYYFAYLVALISLSQASVIIRWSQENPLVLGGWRLFFASILLRIFYEMGSKFYKSKDHNLEVSSNKKNGFRSISKKQKIQIVTIGFLFFLHLFSYAFSAHTIPVNYLMLIYSCNPIFTAIANRLIFQEAIKFKHYVAFIFAFLGIYVLVGDGLKEVTGKSIPLIGVVSAVVAAITFAAYSIFSKKIRRELPNSLVTSLFYGVASAFFFITTLSFGLSPLPEVGFKGWVAIALLTIFPTILGHSVFTFCMNHIDIQVLSIGKLIEPVFAALTAFVILGEPVTLKHLFAFVLISAGISALFVTRGKKHQ